MLIGACRRCSSSTATPSRGPRAALRSRQRPGIPEAPRHPDRWMAARSESEGNPILDSLLAGDRRKVTGNQGTGSKPPRPQLPTGIERQPLSQEFQGAHHASASHIIQKRPGDFPSLPDLRQGNDADRGHANLRKRNLRIPVQQRWGSPHLAARSSEKKGATFDCCGMINRRYNSDSLLWWNDPNLRRLVASRLSWRPHPYYPTYLTIPANRVPAP